MTSDDLDAQLSALKAQMDNATAQAKPITEAIETINTQYKKEYDAYQEHLKALAEEQRRKAQQVRDEQDKLRQQQFEAQAAFNAARAEYRNLLAEKERQEAEAFARLKAEQEAADRAAQDAALTKRFDILTMGFPWRELAKDHQIKGAHKLVQDRNVILADPMGLGKTLTTIVACDMIERATKDASPEEPFLGEMKEVRLTPPGIYEVATGEPVLGYVPYDTKNKRLEEGIYEKREATYGFKIVGGVEKPSGRRVLYLCPASLLRNVMDEWRMWSPKRNVTYIGNMTRAERKFALSTLHMLDNYVIICNYEAWRRDQRLLDNLIEAEFDTIIIDEAHNIKDMKAGAYAGVERLIQGLDPSYIIPMTGTPVLNRPQELFTLLHIVNPVQFAVIEDYLYNYCEQREDDKWYFKPGGLDRLAKQISTNFLRRTKDQAGIQLPPKTVIHHDLEVDEERWPLQAKARKQMKEFATIIIDEAEGKSLSATAVIALYTRLRQIETWPAGIIQYRKDPITKKPTKEIALQLDVEESQKVDYCISYDEDAKEWNGLIPEAIGDERMVLFSQFKAPLRELRDRINAAGFRAVVLDGETSNEIRNQIRLDFDARHTPDRVSSKWDIVLCNYKVGGVGFNFTAASQLIALDEEWNPGKREQAYDRIDRIGQIRPTTIHVVRAKDTIDDWLAAIMSAKEDMVDGLMNKMTDTDFLNKLLKGDITDLGDDSGLA